MQHKRRLLWVSQNRGQLTYIADKVGKSSQFVGMVLRGERANKDGEVEKLLKERGAPVGS